MLGYRQAMANQVLQFDYPHSWHLNELYNVPMEPFSRSLLHTFISKIPLLIPISHGVLGICRPKYEKRKLLYERIERIQ